MTIMTYVEVINITILIGRDEPSLAFGAVWAVASFLVPARFRDDLFFGGISLVIQLEVV
jgi:hypothetical protein